MFSQSGSRHLFWPGDAVVTANYRQVGRFFTKQLISAGKMHVVS